MSEENCVFCKIARGELSAKKEYEDDELMAFHSIDPQAPVHVLVVPKKHIPSFVEAKDEDTQVLGKCQQVCAEVAKKLGVGEAFRVIINSGEAAGQTVFHLHYHVLGGWKIGEMPRFA